MKKGKLLVLILIIMCCSSALILGCGTNAKLVDDDYKAAGLRKVTLYYNGGASSGTNSTIYFVNKDGRLPLPGSFSESATIINPTNTGYQFYGWYEVKPDALETREELMFEKYTTGQQGKPIYNTKGEQATREVPLIKRGDEIFDEDNIVTLREFEEEQQADYDKERLFIKQWNFDFDRVSEDIVLVAIWEPQRYYTIIPPENKNDDVNAIDYKSDYIFRINASGAVTMPSISQLPKRPGFQIEGYYTDRACTIPVQWDIQNRIYPDAEYTEDGSRFKVFPIYIKWLDASYRIISSASNLTNMASNQSYYISKDLDFSGITNFSVPATYRGKIRGNGHEWRNLNVTINQTRDNEYGGIFGDLIGATIEDINFVNLNLSFVRINPQIIGNQPAIWAQPVKFNVFAKSIDSLTVIRNINLGDSTNPAERSTYSVVEYSEFDSFQKPTLSNGFPLRWTEGVGIQGPELIAAIDEEGNYPQEGEEYNGRVIKYLRSYDGQPLVKTEAVTDRRDGRVLYGNMLYLAPDAALKVNIGQATDNFGIDGANIIDCQVNIANTEDIEDADTSLPWRVDFKPGDQEPIPLSHLDYTTGSYFWAGWYTEDYEFWDFNTEINQPVRLIAMWKLNA